MFTLTQNYPVIVPNYFQAKSNIFSQQSQLTSNYISCKIHKLKNLITTLTDILLINSPLWFVQ